MESSKPIRSEPLPGVRTAGKASVALDQLESLRELMQYLAEPFLLLDDSLRVRTATTACCRLLQCSPEAVAGQSIFVLVGGAWDRPDLRLRLAEEWAGRGTGDWLELPGPAGDGQLQVLPQKSARLGLMVLALRGVMEPGADHREIVRLNAELRLRAAELEEVNRELKEVNRELEAFNYSVAHDLRQPLTAINGYCQVIQDLCGDRLDPNCNGFLDEILGASLHLNQLIRSLLNFSRIAHTDLQCCRVDLSALGRVQARLLQHSEPRRRVDFHIADGLECRGDEGLLRVMLGNLFGNAWKFTSSCPRAVIEFGVSEQNGRTLFQVRDNGVGFPMEVHDQLFAPFKRLHDGEDAELGFGIGLATVERIVLRHGGRIWAESEPGRGASFYFELPDLKRAGD